GCLGIEITRAIEPVRLQTFCIHDESLAFPPAEREPHCGIGRWLVHRIQMDGARRIRECEIDVDFVSALDDLKRIREDHRTGSPGQIEFQLGITIDPVFGVVTLLRCRRVRVRNPAVTSDDAERSGYATGRAKSENRRCWYPGVFVRKKTRLRDGPGSG